MDNVLLGNGVIARNGVSYGITSGGKFEVKQTVREIEFDGKYGKVKGGDIITEQRPILTFDKIKFSIAALTNMYAGTSYVSSGSTYNVLSGTLTIASGDYTDLMTWTGYDTDGKMTIIELDNAINLNGISVDLTNKEEVKFNVQYEGTYLDSALTTPPWRIKQAKSAAVDIAVPTAVLNAPLAGAKTQIVVEFNEQLHADTYAITDRFNLLSSLENNAVAIVITTAAGSVSWFDTTTSNPKCLITIASTTFVSGQIVELEFKANAVKDLAGNVLSNLTPHTATVI